MSSSKIPKQVRWQKLNWTDSYHPASNQPVPICIGSSIWSAQNKEKHAGMVEYHHDSDTTSPAIPYPEHFNTVFCGSAGSHRDIVSCKYKKDSILLIDHHQLCSIAFDTKTRRFFDIYPFTGHIIQSHGSSCITVGDYLHIFDGNRDCEYTICSIKDNTSQSIIPEHEPQHCSSFVPVIKTNGSYKSSDKRIISWYIRNQSKTRIPSVISDLISKFCVFEVAKFGGIKDFDNCLDSFYIGTLKDDDAAKPIRWNLAPEYTLKYPLSQFGYIQHGALLVTFGGETQDHGPHAVARWSQDIFVLDLSMKLGWVKSPVQCPATGCLFHAVLDQDLRVHLLTRRTWYHNTTRKCKQIHYCMKLKDIIPQSMYS